MSTIGTANVKDRILEAEFLSQTAQYLLEMECSDDIFTYVCETVNSLVENAAVLVSSFNQTNLRFRLEAITGIDEHSEKVMELLQGNPLGLNAFLEEEETADLKKQKLVLSSLDFKTHLRGAMDDSVRQMIEKLFGVSDIYVMGFSRKSQIFGDVMIVFKKNGAIKNKKLIEAFIKQASVALERRRYNLSLIDSRKKIAEEKEKLVTTFRSIADGVITTGFDGKIQIMSSAAERITGWTQQEAEGKYFCQVLHVLGKGHSKEKRDLLKSSLPEVCSAEVFDNIYLVNKSGGEVPVAYTTSPIINKDNETSGVVFIFRDISRNLELLKTIQRTQKLDALALLTSGIAHDFNNILGGLYGNIELAKKNCSLDCSALGYIDKAISSFYRARALTQQLLTFSKEGTPILKRDSIADTVENCTSFALSGSNVCSDFQIEKKLWHCDFDENLLSQVFDNIVVNAKQSMPNGGKIVVSINNKKLVNGQVADLESGRYVCVEFIDSGSGIPQEVLKNIFDPFFTTKKKGNGLGLSICHSIVRKHNGAIEVESDNKKGTLFKIYLPAKKPIKQKTLKNRKTAEHQGCGTILLIDDDKTILEVTGGMLTTMGYRTIKTVDGESAIKCLSDMKEKGKTCEAIISDLTIPGGMGGRESVKRIHQIFPDVPVIVSSGYSDDPVMQTPSEYGFVCSIKKPYMTNSLSKALETCISINSKKS